MSHQLGIIKKIPTFADAKPKNAAVAQLVEHQLPKLRVASSSLVCRSMNKVLRMNLLSLFLVLYLCLLTLFILFYSYVFVAFCRIFSTFVAKRCTYVVPGYNKPKSIY